MRAEPSLSQQSLMTDQFLYFFLRLRKERIRKVVAAVNAAHPADTAEQKARRLIAAQTPLSFLGGALTHLPMLLPGVGQVLGLMGVAGGTSVITRMHLYLILEIALLFGKDIDDSARVPEMLAVVAATGMATGAPLLVHLLDFNPLYAVPAAGVTASSVAQLVGEEAIRFYAKSRKELPVSSPVHAAAAPLAS